MKKTILLVAMISGFLASAQQTAQLRKIKENYDQQEVNYRKKCDDDIAKVASDQAKNQMQLFCKNEIKKINAARNLENLAELQRIKKEGTGNFIDPSKFHRVPDEIGETKPEFPGGNAAFQNEIISNFDMDAIQSKTILKSSISFVIERDGSIAEVHAEGENEDFNRQAELSLYQTKQKWTPARMGGEPVRYRMRVPITLNFE